MKKLAGGANQPDTAIPARVTIKDSRSFSKISMPDAPVSMERL
jgi:hypothetical protein